jgi:RNA polymerase sigma-70 factor, ECF subfamily
LERGLEISPNSLTQIYSRNNMEHSSSHDRESETPPSLTDAEVLRALKAGQSYALVLLYERYGSVVYGVALKILKNPQEAEDLTQEIFLTLWRNTTYNSDRDYFIRYLITMTRSRAIDKLRARARNLKLLNRWGQTEIPETSSPTPFEQASLTERSQKVRDALTKIPERQRQAIELAYDEGLSQSEIAAKLDMPLGTVKTLTRQGLLRLKQILQNSME